MESSYNPAPLIKWIHDEKGRSFVDKGDSIQLIVVNPVSNSELYSNEMNISDVKNKNKKECKAILAERYVNSMGLSARVANFKKIYHDNTSKTPLEVLKLVMDRIRPHPSGWDLCFAFEGIEIVGTLTVKDDDNGPYLSRRTLLKDHSYCKHKIATTILGKLSKNYTAIVHELAGSFLPQFQRVFYKGQCIKELEGACVEFKGGAKLDCMRPEQLRSSFSKYGEVICGFLNAREGGTLYIGVHDSGIVQGIKFKDRDQFDNTLLALQDSLKSKMFPKNAHDYYSIVPYELGSVAKENAATVVPSPDCAQCSADVKKLHELVYTLMGRLEGMNKDASDLEFIFVCTVNRVHHDLPILFQYGDVFYERNGAQTSVMSIESIIENAGRIYQLRQGSSAVVSPLLPRTASTTSAATSESCESLSTRS